MPALRNLYDTYQKPVLIDEIGYASQYHAAHAPALSYRKKVGVPTMVGQAHAYAALLRAAARNRGWLRGVVWFYWGVPGGPTDLTYSPRDKTAECVLAEFWANRQLRGTRIPAHVPAVCVGAHI
jgi:arabinogalactan endo-1,4-beta-galactosidase